MGAASVYICMYIYTYVIDRTSHAVDVMNGPALIFAKPQPDTLTCFWLGMTSMFEPDLHGNSCLLVDAHMCSQMHTCPSCYAQRGQPKHAFLTSWHAICLHAEP